MESNVEPKPIHAFGCCLCCRVYLNLSELSDLLFTKKNCKKIKMIPMFFIELKLFNYNYVIEP